MRNKGFFWFLTILMTVICLYQLSFTWVASSEERKAEKQADIEVAELLKEAKAAGLDSIVLPYSGAKKGINDAGTKDIIKADIVNGILSNKNEKEVYPVLGTKYKDVKSRSLALGLDLVGGMSITMELSIPGMVENYAKTRDLRYVVARNAAVKEFEANGGDYIEILIRKNQKLNKGASFVDLFAIHNIAELKMNSTDADVEAFLRDIEESAMDGVEEIISRRINQFGVAQPNIEKDKESNRIYIELPGVQDEKTVADKIGTVANLEFYEAANFQEIGGLWQRALEVSAKPLAEESDAADDDFLEEDDSTMVDDTSAVADDLEDLEDLGLTDTEDKKALGLAGLVQTTGSGFIIGYATPENKSAAADLLKRVDIVSMFQNVIFMWSEETYELEVSKGKKERFHALYACKVPADGKARLTGKDIASASDGFDADNGSITVNLSMTDEGSEKWAQMTTENVGEVICITLDGIVYSAPNVINPITGGSTEISGTFTIEEAKSLAALLNAGALPAPCVIKEQSRVGPTIGAENSRAGLMSFAIALGLVFVYMIFYYGKAGIVADIALIANILFIFGSLASFGAVLTLAGIAGIVLTIGMAVDANVLIFERVREEQAAGKDLKAAIDTGFRKALSSIIDANVTTMLTAIVLKSFGQGPIESFATTLIIGIFTSVFAALVITRLLMTWWMKRGNAINFESKMTKNAFKSFNIDFVGKRKMFYGISGVLFVASIAMLVTRGLNPSVEFSGGRTYGFEFEKEAGKHIDKIEANLKKVLVDENGKTASVQLKTKDNNNFLEITTNYRLKDEGAEVNEEVKNKIAEGLANSKALVGSFENTGMRSVSSKISDELLTSSLTAIALSLLIIFGYILMRFGKWQYSTGAILAMVHDVTIVLGIFAGLHGILPFNMDIDQAFIAAILTVIGYSINDTVIVFDRIRENLGLHKSSNEQDQINISLNSTLSRTINTSMTTLLVLLIIFFFGGAAIKGFILALIIGVLVGTYSSVCIATPVLIDLSGMKKAKKSAAQEEIASAES